MNQTHTQPPRTEGRSLRGGVAAISTLAAIAGPAFSAARFEALVVAGDHVQVTYDDAATAAAVADRFGIGGLPVSHTPQTHTWSGTVAELKVDVHGRGYLPAQVPGQLVHDVLGDPTAPGYIRAALAAVPSPARATELDALTDAGRVPVHVVLEVAAVAVTVALSFILPIGTTAALMGAVFTLALLGAHAVVRIQDAGRRRAHLAARRTLASDLYAVAVAARRAARAARGWARHRLASPDAAYDAQVEPLTDARVLTLSAGEIR